MSASLSALYFLVTTVEFLAEPQTVCAASLSDWSATSTGHPVARRLSASAWTRWLFQPPAWKARCWTTMAASILVLCAGLLSSSRTGTAVLAGAAGWLALHQILLFIQRPYGLDGSDQMGLVLAVALVGVFGFGADSAGGQIAIGFVAAQVTLAYFVSGAGKLRSPEWRSGRALAGILSTRAYGLLPVAALLARHRGASSTAGWLVIAWEMSFPIAVVIGGQWLLAFLLAGVAFHVTTYLVMRLNAFLWAFVATYPLVLAARGLI